MRTTAVSVFLLVVFATSIGLGASLETVAWHWSPPPAFDAKGAALPAPVCYEVYLLIDDEPARLAATVRDTLWKMEPLAGLTYRVQVRALDGEGQPSPLSELSEPWTASSTSGVAEVARARLGSAAPNPFNPSTTISYEVPDAVRGGVSLRVVDLRGRIVRELEVDASPGPHQAHWNGRTADGRAAAAGVYLVQFRCGRASSTIKVTLLE